MESSMIIADRARMQLEREIERMLREFEKEHGEIITQVFVNRNPDTDQFRVFVYHRAFLVMEPSRRNDDC